MIKSGKLLLFFNKYSLIVFIAVFLTFFITSPAHAQTSSTFSTEETPVNIQQLSPYSPQIASLAIYNFSHAVSCIISGSSPIAPCLEYKFSKNIQGTTSSIPYLSSVNTNHGLLGMSASVIDNLYLYRPLNKGEYLAELGKNIGLVKETKAQVGGGGNAVLSPVFKLWEVTRNIAYLVMIVIFIVVGLMVMFRQKLNPQTVVSIQLALPGLVIGLILITFSYFLAALITDMAFLGTDLVGYYFQTASNTPNTSLTYQLGNKNALTIGGSFIGAITQNQLEGAAGEMLNALPEARNPNLDIDFKTWLLSDESWLNTWSNPGRLVKLTAAFAGFTFGNAFGGMLGGLAGGIAGLPFLGRLATYLTGFQGAAGPLFGAVIAGFAIRDTPGFLGFAFYFVAVFAILYTLLRLALALINNYLQIIFLTITAPFHFLVASLPGKQDVAVTWIRNMLCHVLTFPAVVGVFYFAAFMLKDQINIPGLTIGSATQLTSTSTLPLFGGLDLSLVQSLLAFGAILATPKIPDIICKAIGKPGQAGGVVDQTIMAGIGSGQKYSGQYGQGFGQTFGQVGQSWTKWKGNDPYESISQKFYARNVMTGGRTEGELRAGGNRIQRALYGLTAPAMRNEELREVANKGIESELGETKAPKTPPKVPPATSHSSGLDREATD